MGRRDAGNEESPATAESSRWFLRHAVATVAYRAAKVLRDAPDDFAEFRLPGATRTPGAILAHMSDLLDWALSIAAGANAWRERPPAAWEREVARFFTALGALDAYLASDAPLRAPAQRLFQGPIADVLSHVGQLATRRRLAGAPVRGENYFVAEITAGRVGPEQAPPRREFE